MTTLTCNEKFHRLLESKPGKTWLRKACDVLQRIKPGDRLNVFVYVDCMTKYLEAAAQVPPSAVAVLPVQRFIEYLAGLPDRVLFDDPRLYPEPSGLYLIKKLPRFFHSIEDSPEQSDLFARAVAAADQASVRLLNRLGNNCGLLQHRSTANFLNNKQTYYGAFLRLCRDALMEHDWRADDRSLHCVWDTYDFQGVAGTHPQQQEEERIMAVLAGILPSSFDSVLACPYASVVSGREFTPRMLDIMVSMDMNSCLPLTRSHLLGTWCHDNHAGWSMVKKRYPDYAMAVNLHQGLLGNMGLYENRLVMQQLWEDLVVTPRFSSPTLDLPAEFSHECANP